MCPCGFPTQISSSTCSFGVPPDARSVTCTCNQYCADTTRSLAAGIREVVVFHSTYHELHRYVDDVPFAVVADPDGVLYAEFGVESSTADKSEAKFGRPATALNKL